jgi:hypothetical protein
VSPRVFGRGTSSGRAWPEARALARALLLVADCQLPAALGAARGQDATAVLRAHARQEAVLSLARDALRLVGTLDHVVYRLL